MWACIHQVSHWCTTTYPGKHIQLPIVFYTYPNPYLTLIAPINEIWGLSDESGSFRQALCELTVTAWPPNDEMDKAKMCWWCPGSFNNVARRSACKYIHLPMLTRKKDYSTQYSRVVPHHSTDCADTSLTSEIGRDPVLSGAYGRNQNGCITFESYPITMKTFFRRAVTKCNTFPIQRVNIVMKCVSEW